MADPTPYPAAGDDTGVGPGRESPPGMPRWVKVSGIIALVAVLLVVVVLLIGGGNHGPGRHSGGASGATPASGVGEIQTASVHDLGGPTPPEGGR